MAGPLSNAACSPQLAQLLETRLRAILFSLFCTCVRPGDTRRASAEAAPRLLKILAQQRLSFSIKQIPRLGRLPAGESRSGRSRRRSAIISQKL